MASIEKEIESHITAFVTDLNTLVRRAALDAVSQALNGTRVAAGRGRALSSRSTRGKGEKRAPAEIARLTASLSSYIQKNPGQRIEQIGKALKIATKELTLPVKKLLADKKIRSKGQRRATTYLPTN